MIGKTISHYRILEKLGGGGMGVVYRAEDTKLKRTVALKFLPEGLSRDRQALERFQREAEAASALNHPNICVIHDIDEYEGQPFIAMEYLEGGTLKAHIKRGPLPVLDALDLGCQMAEALAEAHAHGIVHRDMKPANVMLTKSGRVKLVDFGLARLPEMAGVTTTGVAIGTPAYMAPEQVRGETIDGRADLWALGVVLYEMLAGQHPFASESVQGTVHGVLNRAPEPVERLRPGLPPPLVRIVSRALTKDAVRRYQQAEQMLADLQACRQQLQASPARVESERRVPSIAVLPFANLSADKEQEYFCDGMTEELITALSALPGLRVAAHSSSFQFKGQALDIRKVGEQLNVETVLEGSVRKLGERLRVAAQLVNVSDGYHLWSERYDRRLDDVFEVQDEIARSIVEKLKVKLIGEPEAPLFKRGTANMEAYQLYLQGRYYFARRYKGGLGEAVDCFSRAVAIDPDFAPAWAGLGESYGIMSWYAYGPLRELHPKAMEAARRALTLDERLPEAHHALAVAHMYLEWNWTVIEREFMRALALNPNAALTHTMYALVLAAMGRDDDAVREAECGTAIDPLSAIFAYVCGLTYHLLRRLPRAIEELQKAVALDPYFVPGWWGLAVACTASARHEEAIAAAERAVTLSERAVFCVGFQGLVLGDAGRMTEARRVLEELIERSRREYVPLTMLALVHFGLGEDDEALACIERQQAQDKIAPFILVSPWCDRIRGDPRLTAMLAATGYTGPWLHAGSTGTQSNPRP
jgi:serine/threonine protein kinase/Flp pilus assembly protein TadD